MKYLLIDPFNQGTSGVTTYCRLARARLAALGWSVDILARAEHEALADFRLRVAQASVHAMPPYACVEAPETLAVTRHIHDASRLHIRLHGSRHFGAWLQGLTSDPTELAAERAEVERARWVSAPSHAAVSTHGLHFGDTRLIRVYPNSAPDAAAVATTAAPEFDFLFLGRWQPLKGATFFAQMVRALPESRFAVACAERPVDLPAGARHLPTLTPVQRAHALSRAAVVVIPSLFETASMVALEALASGRPVVTWAHVGAAEYAKPPSLYAARPWDLDDLIVKALLARNRPLASEDVGIVQRINADFDHGARALLADQPDPRTIFPREPLSPANYRHIFATMPSLHSAQRKTVFQRKWRKLMRDPAAYWRDSVLGRAFAGAKPSAVGHGAGPTPSAPAAVAGREPQVHRVGIVPRTGFVKLKAPAKAVAGWRVCIVHAAHDTERVEQLVSSLGAFQDFSPFLRNRLNLLSFEHDSQESLPELIGRFDQKNKELLAEIDHMLLLDAPANLAEALRSCAPGTRTVAIVTHAGSKAIGAPSSEDDDANDNTAIDADADAGADAENAGWALPAAGVLDLPQPHQADALVCLAGSPWAESSDWRRKLVIEAIDQLPVALLRLVRETGPKTRDMLFQIRGEPRFDPDLHDFDPARFQGRIRIGAAPLPRAATLRELIQRLSPEVAEMYVLESVYMRYRSLCNEVEAGASPDRLIEACLHDGVLFDVA